MTVYLPKAPAKYDPLDQDNIRTELIDADSGTRKKGADVDILGARLILRSPDGTRWNVTVDDAGAITATAL